MSRPFRPAVLLPLVAVTVAAAGLVISLLNRSPATDAAPEAGATLAELVPGVVEPLTLITATEPGTEASLVTWAPGEAEPDRIPIGVDARFALWSHDGDRALVLTHDGELALVALDGSTRRLTAGVGTVAWHRTDPGRIAYTTTGQRPSLVTGRIDGDGLDDGGPGVEVPAGARVIAWDDEGFVLVDTRGSGGVLWLDGGGTPIAHRPSVLAAAGSERLLLIPVPAGEVEPSWDSVGGAELRPLPTGPIVTDLRGSPRSEVLVDEVATEPVVWGLIDRRGERVALGARGGEGIAFRLVAVGDGAGPPIGPVRGRPIGFGAHSAVFVVDVGGGELILADRAPVEVDLGLSGVAGLAP